MKPSIQRKLQTLVERHEELGALLSDAEIINNQNRFRELSKEYSQLEPIVSAFKRHEACLKDIEEMQQMLNENDFEMQQLAKQELKFSEELLAWPRFSVTSTRLHSLRVIPSWA